MQDCYLRSVTYVGTCQWDPPVAVKNGILSSDPESNWYYHDYNSVFIRYCDGTGHQGSNAEPYDFNGTHVWFRGGNNTIEVLNYISQKLGFLEAQEVLVAGSSAGSVSVLTWIDYIAGLFGQNKVDVYGVVDAGIFLDEKNVATQSFWYRKVINNFMQYSNKQTAVIPPDCGSYYSDEPWKCMMGQYLLPFIRSPLFIVESLYDSWSLTQILGLKCVVGRSIEPCSQEQRSLIE